MLKETYSDAKRGMFDCRDVKAMSFSSEAWKGRVGKSVETGGVVGYVSNWRCTLILSGALFGIHACIHFMCVFVC